MNNFKYIFIFLVSLSLTAQSSYHVAPNGDTSSSGTITNPWDLQTALSSKIVQPGDTIYLHKGIYTGKFTSSIQGSSSKKITVLPYKNEKVTLNGNNASPKVDVLRVIGGNVIFKDLEITYLGNFSRNEADASFRRVNGLIHTTGENCEFINLKIHNNPGLGVGSWKSTAGTIFDGCLVYNNGYVAKNGKGTGEGFYVQNKSEKERIIKNCIVFNNYYKGIEVWSANKNADFEYVKNVTLKNNILFNNGSPINKSYDNLIIASDDRNGINIAQKINVEDNILYHNTNFLKNEINGDAPSLTLGFNSRAPIKDVIIKNNIIIGRNNGMRILYADRIKFESNIVYSGYIMQTNATNRTFKNWKFKNNTYYTKNNKPIFISKDSKLTFEKWKSQYKVDIGSKHNRHSSFDLNPVLDITKLTANNTKYRVTLFNKQGNALKVNFLDKDISEGTNYRITNITSDVILSEGILNTGKEVIFELGNHNGTANNFGVYFIEFDSEEMTEEKKKSFFKRIFGWLF